MWKLKALAISKSDDNFDSSLDSEYSNSKTPKTILNDEQFFFPQYENKTINGYQIVFTEEDCSEETPEVEKLMNQYSIEGYPTIKLIKDGQIIEYDAKPSKETLNKFLNTVL